MTETALTVSGDLAICDGTTANLGRFGIFSNLPAIFAPVFASTPAYGCLAYRGPQDDAVYVVGSTGFTTRLAPRCTGKWAVGIVALDGARFLVGWLTSITVVELAIVDLAANTVTPQPSIPITESQVLLALTPGQPPTARGEGDGPTTITRGDVTVTLLYWTVRGTFTLGIDGTFPVNRVLVADQSAFYIVATNDHAAQFPPSGSDVGSVATYPGAYASWAEIQAHPLVPGTEPPVEPPNPPNETTIYVKAGDKVTIIGVDHV